jgi:integrase/recombinase XerD
MSSTVYLTDAVTAFFLAHDYTPKSETFYNESLSEFLGWCERQHLATVGALTVEHLRSYVKWMQARPAARTGKPLRSATVGTRTRAVRAFVNFCVQEGWLSADIPARWKLPRVEEDILPVLTAKQVDTLFASAHDSTFLPLRLRDESVLGTLLSTGIRVSELTGLRLDDVWLRPHEAFIRVHRKWRKWQDIPLNKSAARRLSAYLAFGRNALLELPPGERAIRRVRVPQEDEVVVYLSRTGQPMTKESLQNILGRLVKRAGPEHFRGVRVSPHTFRHTFAVHFLEQGGDIYDLKSLLGHSTIKDTERYLRALQQRRAGDVLRTLDRLPGANGGNGSRNKRRDNPPRGWQRPDDRDR